MLSVAAAATAASLVGSNSEEAVAAVRSTVASIEGDDGNFERFLQSLRSGRLNTLLSPDNTNSLQFFRVFQFGSHAGRRDGGQRRPTSDRRGLIPRNPYGADYVDEDNGEGRLVPVLMIGIRSLNGDETPSNNANDMVLPSLFESFGGGNVELDGASARESASLNHNMPSGRNGVNFSQRRRASMGGLGLFSNPSREGSRRSHRASDASRLRSEVEPAAEVSTPPGPYPPPTTPSSLPLSSLSSGASTPTRRASVSSMARRSSSINPDREFHHRTAHTALEATEEEEAIGNPRPTRARRLSESDFMRYGSGSARRNGVVEPDHGPTDRENSRSWIIYVLGGSYPENHPILTTPSLFTDSPTYEDMLLLSSMLGPAKPPVASRADLLAAGGLYTICRRDGFPLELVGGDPAEHLPLEVEQKCPVCICELEEGETARRLQICHHVFHQTCIDEVSVLAEAEWELSTSVPPSLTVLQWLTTGRNACPLCRGEGVAEQASSGSDVGESSRSAARLGHDD